MNEDNRTTAAAPRFSTTCTGLLEELLARAVEPAMGSDGQVAGVLDWELAGPASPLYDTGYLAWFTVPLMDDARARARGFPRPPGRLARLNAFARGTRLPVSELLGAAL